ncbi:hypothetical protein [Flavihumibacter petaseus]|uniref:ZU5 domain-containing protein n=1 Tax=Flavihumibacter petaseus NBRC 106054 TaxID=1220578 RepID=A0A0E9MYM2_9BACT|nr:hypothetical protein [Flavihumibacter petaseus]GAO42608.1 hypothetical protein FPE01S_01_16230 [Flavihumibacter petaseus NBRC 106054]
MKRINRWFSVMLFTILFSCSKTDQPEPVSNTPLITLPGQPDGPSVTKSIGTAGGTISTADGRIRLEIPAGALAEERTISIQPVSNQLPSGYGKAYRLEPHDIQFQQPARVTFHYDTAAIRNTVPDLLGIAYQDSSGSWLLAGEPELDRELHTLSVNTTHFSDWGFFPFVYIDPWEATIDPGGQLDLRVMCTLPEDYPEIIIPGQTPVNEPAPVKSRFLGAWDYSGDGILEGEGGRRHYTAPNQAPRINPEAISVEVKMKRKAQLMLVSNITIRTEFHIDYMQVDETEMNHPQATYPGRLWIYGSFGDDPGVAKRSVKVNNEALNVVFWTAGMILCDIPSVGTSASGPVVVESTSGSDSKVLNEWIVNMHYDKVESPGGSLTKKVALYLRFRADADGWFKIGQQPMLEETDLNDRSKGIIAMPDGSYTSHVTVDACGDYTVKWSRIPEYLEPRRKNSEGEGLRGWVVYKSNGIDLKLAFVSEDILVTRRIFKDCHSGGSDMEVKDNIEIMGFHESIIPLRFSKRGKDASILGGEMPLQTGTGVASGLFFDPQDINNDMYTTRLRWDAAEPKYR